MLVLKNVSMVFRKRVVLENVSCRIDPKEFVCVTGPSGAGKTTLMSLLIGALRPTSGTIEVDGVDLKKVPTIALQLFRRRVGVVFQDYKLLPNRTVRENILFPLEVCGAPPLWSEKRVDEVLKQMTLIDRADAFPSELSGGERARVSIARAIVHKPLIILADEPTGNLDPVQALTILQLLKDIHAAGTTVILTTHDFALVDTLQTRVIRLEHGKVIRDSVGGYEKAKRTQPKHVPVPAKHEFFAEESTKEEGSSGGKKIHITSIGS
jgi:cell division transport system ATP-binding protein